MIIDVECPVDGTVRQNILTQFEGENPPCPKCGTPMQRRWTLSRPGDHETSNHASVRFHFNYSEDSR